MSDDFRRREIAREWARALIGTSYVPMSRVEAEDFFDQCLKKLIAALPDQRSSIETGMQVGVELVRANFGSPVGLENTLRLLAVEMPGMLAEFPPVSPNLADVLSAVAAGYTSEVREVTLHQQEVIKQAVLRARDAAEAALAATEARFRAVFTSSALGIAIAGLDGVLEDVNSAMVRIFRIQGDLLRGQSLFDLVDAGWSEELRTNEARLVEGNAEQFQVKTRFCTSEGIEVWTQISASLVRDAEGEPAYQVLLYEDITDRHMLQEQLHRQATHDPLTGLANRTLLQSRMDSALRPNAPGRRVGLCYFDLDGFKAVNDSLGHFVGDQLLRAVAQRLHSLTKAEGALAARMGGDEFVVLIPDSRGTKHVIELVERMLWEITRPVQVGDHELNASASVGVVETEVEQASTDQLLRDADITLYRAKSEGKAQWVLFEQEVSDASRHRFHLSTAMPAALERDEFFLEYWPVALLDDGCLCTIEVDIRWDHPEFGELEAAEFLGLAKETGLITKLGNWAVRQACTQGKRLFDRLGSAAPVVAVNLSERHFHDPELVSDVQRILQETGLPPENLRLVVSENGLFNEHDQPLDHAEILSEMGVHLGIADFGARFTRLSRLRGLPIKAAKVSASYLSPEAQDDGADPVDQHVVASLIAGAQQLGLYVVADGVRTAEQAEWLRQQGVYAALGPHIGGLASAMEIEQLITKGALSVR